LHRLGAPLYSNMRSGSGSFGLPRIPLDLRTVASAGPSGPSRLACHPRPKPRTTALMALSSLTERSLKRWNPLSAIPPLLGFEGLPPASTPPCVHSQEPKPPSGQRCHTPTHVPPSWFRATSMVFSALELRVCCTPQPAKGSPRFMHVARAHCPKTARSDGNNSRDAVHTLRRLSLASSRTASLRPLPSYRYRPARR
jgi:hypothetical protein